MPEISTPNLLDQNTHSTKCIPGVYAEMYFQSPNRSQTFDITHIKKESSCRELYTYMAENVLLFSAF